MREELATAEASADATLKKLAEKLKRADAAEASKQAALFAALHAEAEAARAEVEAHIVAFKKSSAEKLANLKRIQAKIKAAELAEERRPGADAAKEDCKKARGCSCAAQPRCGRASPRAR